MNARIVTLRVLAVASAFASLLLAYSTSLAQSGSLSDLLRLSVTDPSGADVAPPVEIPLPEIGGIEPLTITLPARNILFREVNGQSSPYSDYLHIDPVTVIIYSDDENPLQLRPTAKVIPASANEVFLPVSVFAGSDGNPTNPSQESDHVTIYTGFAGEANPIPAFFQQIFEQGEVPEPPIPFATGPLSFDVIEPNSFTGDVSDWVDLPNGLTGVFISSDDPSAFAGLPFPADGEIFEDPINGTVVHYSIGFASDTTVPEPSSVVLMGLAGVGAMLGIRRRLA